MEEPFSTDDEPRKEPWYRNKRLIGVGGVIFGLAIGLIMYKVFLLRRVEELPGSSADFPEDAFRVLVVSDDSRESLPYGYSAKRGADAAAVKLNEKGGIRSHPVAVRFIRAGVTEDEIFQTLNRLLVAQPVQLILDASSEVASPGVVRAGHANKALTMIIRDGSCRTGSRLSEGKISPYVWSLGLTREAITEPFFAFLSEKRGKPESDFQILFLGGDTPLDQDVIDYVRHTSESLGFKTIAALLYDIRLTDFYPVARDVLTRLPDVLFISNRMEPARLFMEQAFKLSLTRDMALAGFEVFAEEWHSNFGKSIEGVYTISKYTSAIETADNKEFLSYLSRPPKKGEKKERRKPAPDATAEAAWSALKIASETMNAEPSLDYAPLQKKFENSEYHLPNGSAFFNPKNHVLVQKMYALRIKEGKYEISDSLGDAHHPETTGCN